MFRKVFKILFSVLPSSLPPSLSPFFPSILPLLSLRVTPDSPRRVQWSLECRVEVSAVAGSARASHTRGSSPFLLSHTGPGDITGRDLQCIACHFEFLLPTLKDLEPHFCVFYLDTVVVRRKWRFGGQNSKMVPEIPTPWCIFTLCDTLP